MTEEQELKSVSGCLIRICWAMVGPALMGAAGLGLILNKSPMGSALDFVFAGSLVAAIAARLLDTRKAGSSGAAGRDSGRTRAFMYVAGALLVGALIFAFAHFATPKIL